MSSKVAAIQMVSSADVEQNLESAASLVADAAGQGAELVLLPEVFAVLEGGPMAQYAEVEGDRDAPIQGFLAALAQQCQITLVAGTIPLISRPGSTGDRLITDGRVRAACLVYDTLGRQIARYDKIHLFDIVLFSTYKSS